MNPMDTRLTGERTRPIGPGIGQFAPNPILAGTKTADMLFDRPVALRNLERAMPNLTSNEPKLRSIENPHSNSIPDLSLRQVPPNMIASTPSWEITQNDMAHYAVPKRAQFPDESIQTRRMLQDQQLIYGGRVPPQMLRNPMEQSGMIGPDNEAYLRVPKRSTLDQSFSDGRNAQNSRFYETWSKTPSDINDVSRRRMASRGDYVQLQMDSRAYDSIDIRNQTMFTRITNNAAEPNVGMAVGARGTGVIRGVTSPAAGIPVDSRRSGF
jgi:hypothetical protein